MNERHKQNYMKLAEVLSELSYAVRLKVGAIATINGRIIGEGVNGTVPGSDNCCEYEKDGKLVTKSDTLHAEQNLIFKLARDGISCKDATIFVTHAPCIECAKGIKTAGFKEVYWRNLYRCTDGLDFLNRHNVKTERI